MSEVPGDCPDDPGLAATILKRRQQDLERRARILQPKIRLYGLDLKTLDQQCAENAERRRAEAHVNDDFNRNAMKADQLGYALELRKAEEKRLDEIACREFSKQHLSKEQRREYHLSDPNAWKTTLPERIGDDDPRNGPASLQRFEGEEAPERLQAELFNAHALKLQMAEREAQRQREKEEEQRWAEKEQRTNKIRTALEVEAMKDQRQRVLANTADNIRLARVKEERKSLSAQAEEQARQKELAHHASDPFLNETVDPRSAHAYKGMSIEQRQYVYDILAYQTQDNAARQMDEKQRDAEFAQKNTMQSNLMSTFEDIALREQQQKQREIVEENRRLAEEQRAQNKLRNELYTGGIDARFYDCFGQSER